MDKAVIYGITPYLLGPGAGFRHVERRLPEWAELGVDALWLQPIFKNHGGGQGYGVMDFFGIREDYGSVRDFRSLAQKAHALGMRVLLDLPLNHVSARAPGFFLELRQALKALNPDIALLAEDKAGRQGIFAEGVDAAYDWVPGEKWVSRWSWQADCPSWQNPTLFNAVPRERISLLRQALFPGGTLPEGPVLRFLENNDTHRFICHHGPAATRLAARLQFTLPGLPLLYIGQEVGTVLHPYVTWCLFHWERPIREHDRHGLWDHYRDLILLRRSEPALRSGDMLEVPVASEEPVFAFVRPHAERPLLCVFNLGEAPATAGLSREGLERAAGKYTVWNHAEAPAGQTGALFFRGEEATGKKAPEGACVPRFPLRLGPWEALILRGSAPSATPAGSGLPARKLPAPAA